MSEPFRQSPVSLTIETTVQNGSDREQFTLTTHGTIYEKKKMTIMTYEEKMEAGKVNNILKISGKRVAIIRRGAVSMRQLFVIGRKTDSFYHTPFGSLSIQTETKDIDFRWNKVTGILLLRYDLSLQGNPPASYTLKMLMKGAQS